MRIYLVRWEIVRWISLCTGFYIIFRGLSRWGWPPGAGNLETAAIMMQQDVGYTQVGAGLVIVALLAWRNSTPAPPMKSKGNP